MDKQALKRLQQTLTPDRFVHSVNVAETAKTIAGYYGVDARCAWIAGILHDCARGLSAAELLTVAAAGNITAGREEEENPTLLHAPVGSVLARSEYGVRDERILSAISVHTLGAENMSDLDKIIFIADKIEPGRSLPGVDSLRELVYRDLNGALLYYFDYSITYLAQNKKIIHPQAVRARNYLLREQELY